MTLALEGCRLDPRAITLESQEDVSQDAGHVQELLPHSSRLLWVCLDARDALPHPISAPKGLANLGPYGLVPSVTLIAVRCYGLVQ